VKLFAFLLSMLKTFLRNSLPLRFQVPLKYFYSHARGWLEPEMFLLSNLVRSGDRVIDIGGNWGIYAYALAALKTHISVFEPNPQCFRALSRWSKDNKNVDIYPVALSSKLGQGQLHIPVDVTGQEHDASGSLVSRYLETSRRFEVEISTLDAFAFENVRFIKIDVEGHELEVLKGSIETIRTSMPVMLIEIEQRHNIIDINDIFLFISLLGYECFYLDGNVLRGLDSFDLDRDQSPSFPSSNRGRYINNFLFVPRDWARFAKTSSRLRFAT